MKRRIIMVSLGFLFAIVSLATVNGGHTASHESLPSIIESQDMPGTNNVAIRLDMPQEKGNLPKSVYPKPSVACAENADLNYSCNWKTNNAGGGIPQSENFSTMISVGQAAIGFSESDNYQTGIGFWYGLAVCDCKMFCDLNLEGTINPVDVVIIVNYVYRQLDSRQQIPNCPGDNGDWNCDGIVNPVDVVWFVNYVYRNSGMGACDPCMCYPCVDWP